MEASPIGVWKVRAVRYVSGADVVTIDPALPGIFIFIKAHYSMTWMPQGRLQADYEDMWHPSDAEKVQSYNAIVTNSGHYEYVDGILTTWVEVAKTPAFVGGKAIYECDLKGDALRLEILDNLAHDGSRDSSYLKTKTVISLERIE